MPPKRARGDVPAALLWGGSSAAAHVPEQEDFADAVSYIVTRDSPGGRTAGGPPDEDLV